MTLPSTPFKGRVSPPASAELATPSTRRPCLASTRCALSPRAATCRRCCGRLSPSSKLLCGGQRGVRLATNEDSSTVADITIVCADAVQACGRLEESRQLFAAAVGPALASHDSRLIARAALVVGSHLVLGPDPWPDGPAKVRRRYGREWAPDEVTLEVNGVRVTTIELFGQTFGPSSHVDLGWPAAAGPGFVTPPLKAVKRKRVRPLGRFERNERLPGRRAL